MSSPKPYIYQTVICPNLQIKLSEIKDNWFVIVSYIGEIYYKGLVIFINAWEFLYPIVMSIYLCYLLASPVFQ